MASSSLNPVKKDGECINWAELPYDLTLSILGRLNLVDILENAQKVCTKWRHVCKDPTMFRKIDMRKLVNLGYDLEIMCRHAVDRSQGGLVEIVLWDFGTDSLLNYIVDRSSSLRSLAMCSTITNEGLAKEIVKIPLLEELEVSYSSVSGESLRVVGQSCPNLKTLKLKRNIFWDPPVVIDDDVALAIAETMHGLRFLQLLGNRLTNAGVNAILDNCPNLEHLDIRYCFNVKLDGDLLKRCSERIKVFRRNDKSTHHYPTVNVMDSIDYFGLDDPYHYVFPCASLYDPFDIEYRQWPQPG